MVVTKYLKMTKGPPSKLFETPEEVEALRFPTKRFDTKSFPDGVDARKVWMRSEFQYFFSDKVIKMSAIAWDLGASSQKAV